MNKSIASHRTRADRLWGVVAIIGLIIAGSVGTLAVWTAPSTDGPVDLHGTRVALDPGDMPSPSVIERQEADDEGQGRVRVPAVGLDVPLGALDEVDGVITPPGFTSMYWVRNRGVRPSDGAMGTVYIVTHSLRGEGIAPGNYLFDTATGTSALARGDRITVDGASYAVTETRAVAKSELAAAQDVWDDIPDRLVLITCLQVPAGTPSVQNFIIFADRLTP